MTGKFKNHRKQKIKMVSGSDPTMISHLNDDDDEEGFYAVENQTSFSIFKLKSEPNSQFNCKLLIIADGNHASAFARTCLLSDSPKQPVAKIEKETEPRSDEEDLWGLHNRKPNSSLLYQLNDSTILCLCSPYLIPPDDYAFASTILESLSPRNILILTSLPAACYKSDVHISEMSIPFTRSLITTAFSDPVKIVRLERPNIVNGISAGVMSACERQGLPAAACIVYTSSLDLELGVLESFSDFLTSFECSKHVYVNQKSACLDAHNQTGNLYM